MYQHMDPKLYSEASFIRDVFMRKHRDPGGFLRERKNAM